MTWVFSCLAVAVGFYVFLEKIKFKNIFLCFSVNAKGRFVIDLRVSGAEKSVGEPLDDDD